jgi:hypothetical protein
MDTNQNNSENIKKSQPIQKQSNNPPTANKSGEDMQDKAQSLLEINNLKVTEPSKKSPLFLSTMIILIIIIIITALLFKPNQKNNSSSTNPNVSLPSSNNPLNNNGSINQQVKYCSNIVNAGAVC